MGSSSLQIEAALQPLRTALTHTSAGLEVNHEELEFLGDAVLRLACAEFLEENNPSSALASAQPSARSW